MVVAFILMKVGYWLKLTFVSAGAVAVELSCLEISWLFWVAVERSFVPPSSHNLFRQ